MEKYLKLFTFLTNQEIQDYLADMRVRVVFPGKSVLGGGGLSGIGFFHLSLGGKGFLSFYLPFR